MRLGYLVSASHEILRHPHRGIERVRRHIDRYRNHADLKALGMPATALYEVVTDWQPRLHAALGQPWPCPAAHSFGQVWDGVIAELTAAGARTGLASYGGVA